MFKALFNIIINLLATIVQLVLYPLNAVVENLLPDLTDRITYITSNVSSIFDNASWFVNILPPITREVIFFAVSVLIVKYSIYIGTHAVIKIWNLFQKLKFW